MNRQTVQIVFLALFGMLSAIFSLYYPFESKNIDPSSERKSETSTGQTSDDINLLLEPLPLSGDISLLLPTTLWNSGFENFILEFQRQFSGLLLLDYYGNSFDFLEKDLISYDIVLLPYEFKSSFPTEKIFFQEDLSNLFHPVFGEILKQDADFFPFALDPLLSFSHDPLPQSFKLSNLADFLQQWSKKNRFSLPFFGFLQHDGLFDNNLYLSLMIDRLLKVDDMSAFRIFVENYTFDEEEALLSLSFLDKIEVGDLCRNNPPLCLFSQNLLSIYFGTYSDQKTLREIQTNVAFTGKPSTFFVSTFPYHTLGYPMRAYGFAVVEGHKTLLVEKFLLGYLQMMFEENTQLWEKTLPAFKDSYFSECESLDLCKYFSEIDLIDVGLARIQQIMSDPLLIRALQKKYDPSLFFKNTSL